LARNRIDQLRRRPLPVKFLKSFAQKLMDFPVPGTKMTTFHFSFPLGRFPRICGLNLVSYFFQGEFYVYVANHIVQAPTPSIYVD
jgi:hypothetical protein